MSGRTPGPWFFEHDSECGHYSICSMQNQNNAVGQVFYVDNAPCPQGEADARLVAAAPELLAILDDTIAAYGKPGGPWNVPSDPGGWLDRARKLSAKAKGETA